MPTAESVRKESRKSIVFKKMWNNKSIRYEEMFQAMVDYLNERIGDDNEVYLVSVGDISSQCMRSWISLMTSLGQKLMHVARGLALMKGRNDPSEEDFTQAAYLLSSGRISSVFRRADENESEDMDKSDSEIEEV